MLNIAHISDLHLHKIKFDFSQFFSKRWLGNINLIFFRKKKFKINQLTFLPDLFEKLKINYVIVSGDISSTSLKEEFLQGQKLFQEFSKRNIQTLIIPGNHDNYTKKDFKEKTFYKYFTNKQGLSQIEKEYNLQDDAIQAIHLKDNWWYVGIDCTLATHLLSSTGTFSIKIEKKLKHILETLHKKNIILVNHFSFKPEKNVRRSLKRARYLKKILQENKNVKLFLHGHSHHHKILDLRKKNLPIVLDSGSVAHNSLGKWNFLSLEEDLCTIKVFDWKNSSWINSEKKIFNL